MATQEIGNATRGLGRCIVEQTNREVMLMKRVFVGMLACMMVLGLLVSGTALADTPIGTPVST